MKSHRYPCDGNGCAVSKECIRYRPEEKGSKLASTTCIAFGYDLFKPRIKLTKPNVKPVKKRSA